MEQLPPGNTVTSVEPPPPFVLRIDEMRPDLSIPQRVDQSGGDWRPPRPLHTNLLSVKGDWWYFSGAPNGHLQRLQGQSNTDVLPGLEHYKTVSMYCSACTFWIVPYDATQRQVGDGTQHHGEHIPRRPSGWSDSSRSSDVEEYLDWKHLTFSIRPPGSSYATIGAASPRLHSQSVDQEYWIEMLLPDRYHSELRDAPSGSGGLVGELPILLGLKAFSVASADMVDTLNHSLCGPHWPSQVRSRGHGWRDQRGLVVRTYMPAGRRQARAELEAFEQGLHCRPYP